MAFGFRGAFGRSFLKADGALRTKMAGVPQAAGCTEVAVRGLQPEEWEAGLSSFTCIVGSVRLWTAKREMACFNDREGRDIRISLATVKNVPKLLKKPLRGAF